MLVLVFIWSAIVVITNLIFCVVKMAANSFSWLINAITIVIASTVCIDAGLRLFSLSGLGLW